MPLGEPRGAGTYSGEDLFWWVGHRVRGRGGALDECRVVGVDVCGLDVDQALGVVRRGPEAFPQQFRHDLDELRVEPREPLEFL